MTGPTVGGFLDGITRTQRRRGCFGLHVGFNIHPVLLGAGTPAFLDPGLTVKLELSECRALDGGCVLVNYRVK